MSVPAIRRIPSVAVTLFAVLVIFAMTTVSVQAASSLDPPSAPDAPLDTPIVIVNEPSPSNLNEWTIGNGLVYWADRCFGGEFRGDAFLKRKALYGTIERTLATTTAAFCYTYLHMAADDDGVFYYSSDLNQIEYRPIASPYDPPTVVYSAPPFPVTDFELDSDHVYWGANDNRILRVGKDGANLETVANTGNNISDIMLVGSTVYWLDDSGLWSTSTTCGSLPCTKTKLATTTGDHLLYVSHSFFLGYSIYWVENGSQEKIRRYSCSFSLPSGWTCSVLPSPLYTANTNWTLGQLASDGSNLFWPESYFKIGDPSDGRLRRMPTSTLTPVDIAVNLPGISHHLFTDNMNVYFADQHRIMKLPFNASAIVRDLAADKWEVTQGIQNTANDVVLVADKTTYVRVYGKENSGPEAVGVEAYLYGTRGGSPLPGSPLHAINGTLRLSTSSSYDRARIDDGWLFRLPGSWIAAGTINLRVEVDPRQNYSDPNRANNSKSGNFTFTGKAPVCTVFVPVRTHSPYASTSNPNFWPMMDLAKRLWPTRDFWAYHQNSDIAELQVCWWGPFPHPCFGPYELPEDDWKVLTSLNTRDFFSDDPDRCDNANARTHYVGMVHASTNTNVDGGVELGVAYLNDNVAWVKFPAASDAPSSTSDWNFPGPGITLAHELAHNVGRKHVDCGNPDNPDTGYPYPTTQIDVTGPDRHYGFDINSQTPIPPNGAKDMMTYCRPKWISDYNWEAIFNKLGGAALSTASADSPVTGAAPNLAAAGDVVYVSGAVTPTLQQGALNYAWVYPTTAMSAGMLNKWQRAAAPTAQASASGVSAPGVSPAADNYHVRLLDSGGGVLADQTVSLFEHLDGSTSLVQGFVATFPAPSGTVARMELLVNDTVMAALEPGVNLPAVTMVQPAGGETFDAGMTIVWEATDPDSADNLLYSIQYSPDDGVTWRSIASDFPGPKNSNRVTLTLTSLVGLPQSTTNGGRIRVAASDGYHTALATSPGFTVTNRPPEAYIVSPGPGQSAPAGETVLLRGDAIDEEDGGLSGDSLSWTVDGMANGTGEEQSVSGLAPGSYDVVLTAEDSVGATGTAQTTLQILPLAIPQAGTPTLDGFCDDAAYGDGVTVQLKPYADGDQATVHLVRTDSYLWACFTGMDQSTGGPGSFAGVRVDVDHSQDDLAQTDDYGFFMQEDGTALTYTGDGAGNFNSPGPGGLAAQLSMAGSLWQTELRIDSSVLGGWNHIIGMNVGHYWVRFQGDDYHWPYDSGWNQPFKWATTALGSVPQITSLEPVSATVGGPSFELVVSGQNFVDGAEVLWNGTALPTTFGEPTVMTATVDSGKLSAAGAVTISVRNPASPDFVSNGATFLVNNPQPTITSLSPNSAQENGGSFTLTVHGAGFVNGAIIHWDGAARATTFVSSTKLQAQIDTSDLSPAHTAGVSVVNPAPGGGASNSVDFTITPPTIYLPFVAK